MAKIKVSQSTIDQIKKMGMDKALKSAPGASVEMKEGLRRMYGEKRLSAAGGSSTPAANKQPRQSLSGPAKPAASVANKQPRQNTNTVSKKAEPKQPRQANYNAPKKSAPKKESTTSNPLVAAHNKLSPYGDKTQKFKNPLTEKRTVASVSAENAKRMGISVAEYNKRLGSAAARNPEKKKPARTVASVSAENAKRMGISLAEYNRRLNSKKK